MKGGAHPTRIFYFSININQAIMDFQDLDKNLVDGENMGGIVRIFYGYHKDVETWPAKPATPATIEENGVLTGELTMKSGKRMFEFYSTEDTADLVPNIVGEGDARSCEMQLNVFHPRLQKKLFGFMNASKNEDLVFVAIDANGERYVLGDANRAAKMQNSEGSGTQKETTGRNGAGLSFSYKCANLYTYEGKIPNSISGAGI